MIDCNNETKCYYARNSFTYPVWTPLQEVESRSENITVRIQGDATLKVVENATADTREIRKCFKGIRLIIEALFPKWIISTSEGENDEAKTTR